jgi:ATP-dependent Clp protease protease subunit
MVSKSVSYKNISPIIFERGRDGEMIASDIFSRLLKDRIVFIAEEFSSEMATEVISQLLFLDHQNKKPIKLYINSPGGLVHEALMSIYDVMQFIESPIQTICVGTAYSAAGFILASGSPGLRCAFPNSYLMVHSIQTGMMGSTKEILKETKKLEFWNNRLMEILSKHTGQPLETVKKICEEDTFFTAEEAKEFGLIDKIIEPTKCLPSLNVSDKKIAIPKTIVKKTRNRLS